MTAEQKWIRQILRRSSRDAADQLVQAHYDEVYVYVYRQVGSAEDALDLTQEIFISALRSLPSYDEKKAGFRTWLYRIATHKVIDARRRIKYTTVPMQDDDLSDADFTDMVLNQELLRQIEAALCNAPPDVQEVFRLRIYAEYSFPEIARSTGQDEAKVKAQFYRLLKRLRKEFLQHE